MVTLCQWDAVVVVAEVVVAVVVECALSWLVVSVVVEKVDCGVRLRRRQVL